MSNDGTIGRSVNFGQALNLHPPIEGLSYEVLCRDTRIREIIPFPLTPYDEAVRIALAEETVSA